MRRTGFAAAAAIALCALPVAPVRAEASGLRDWCRWVEALVQPFLPDRTDPAIVGAPDDIDPKMVRVPPSPQGTMRIIVPH